MIDAGDLAGLGELLGAAEVSGPGLDPVRGAEAVEALYRATTRLHDDGTPRTTHLVSNPIVEVEGDGAQVRSRFVVLQATRAVPLQPIITGHYHDRFERVGGEWRFAARHMAPGLLGRLEDHLGFDPGDLGP